jgi:SulP family sulfate permease
LKNSSSTLLLGALVAAVMIVWPKVSQRVPSSIVAVIVVTAVAELFHLSVPLLGSLPHSLPVPKVPNLSPNAVRHLLGPALAVATLAAVESLLSARVAEVMKGGGRISDRREMLGQGLANVASGVFGGMPATGAIARTAVNVRAGARTRMAAITHSLVIIAVILVAASVVGRIPLAVLGGVLVVTAVKMVNHVKILTVIRAHASEAVIFGLTAVVTIAVDLVTAIEVGLVVAGILALRAMASGSGATQEDLADHHDGPVDEMALLGEHIAVFRFDGALFFGAVPRFLDQINQIQGVSVVILRLKGLTYIDASGAEALLQIIENLRRRGISVLVKGPRAEHGSILASAGVMSNLEGKGHLFDDLTAAIAHGRQHVDRTKSGF